MILAVLLRLLSIVCHFFFSFMKDDPPPEKSKLFSPVWVGHELFLVQMDGALN